MAKKIANPLSEFDDEELEKELARRKELNKMPLPLEHPNYDMLRAIIIRGLSDSVENSYEDEDFEHYVYEAAMEAVYGTEFWLWRNKQKW